MRPNHHPAMSGQALIGEGNSDRRSAILGVNIQAHRLVRLLWRRACGIFYHKLQHAKRCSLFQTESFRLRTSTKSKPAQKIKRVLISLAARITVTPLTHSLKHARAGWDCASLR